MHETKRQENKRSNIKKPNIVVCQSNTPKYAIFETQNSQESYEIEGFIRESCCAIFEKIKSQPKMAA